MAMRRRRGRDLEELKAAYYTLKATDAFKKSREVAYGITRYQKSSVVALTGDR